MKRFSVFCILMSLALTMIQAIGPNPQLLKELLEQGDTARYNEMIAHARTVSHRSNQLAAKVQARRAQQEFGVSPMLATRGLLILANFSDKSFQATNTHAELDSMMNGHNYTYNGATGSSAQYFSDQSNGAYRPHFDVVGPITLPRNMAYYGSNGSYGEDGGDVKLGDFVLHCCSIAASMNGVDLSDYDQDGDGEMDFVYIIYAGKGEADGGAANTLWPASWDMTSAVMSGLSSLSTNAPSSQYTFDGVRIGNFAYSGEQNGSTGKRNGIGTPTHEFSHVLGLPDFYDTYYGSNSDNYRTPGDWDVMDSGPYNNNGMTPPNYSPWEKAFMGWATPINPGSAAQPLTLQADGTVYQLNSSGTYQSSTTSGVCYLIENRQKTGWDAYLPGHGLLIWKLNYNKRYWEANEPNSSYDRDYTSANTKGTVSYTVVSATGSLNDIGTAADPFPGTGKKTSWSGLTGKPLLNIKEQNGVITLDYIAATKTVHWVVDGDTLATQYYRSGTALQLPDVSVTPCDNRTFIGWTTHQDFNDPFTEPEDLFLDATGKTVTESVTYYGLME